MPRLPKKKNYKPRAKRHDPGREFYFTTGWRETAKRYRINNPLCEECRRQGRLEEAVVTDHIIPIKQGGAIWDERNYQALCRIHDQMKRGKESHNIIEQYKMTESGKIPIRKIIKDDAGCPDGPGVGPDG
jgi:hypothetical protein